MTTIRTYHPRRGRMRERHFDALARLRAVYGVGDDLRAAFRRDAPLVLEIGFGMGEATAEIAAADPGRDYLAVEIHTPGVANLLALVEARAIPNLRIVEGDALTLVRQTLPESSLDAIHAFFPDPWPKARHHKRRLVQPVHVALLASRLVRGGTLRCATDWPGYADAMLATLCAEPSLRNVYERWAPRPAFRPYTKFEQRALDAGRTVRDLVFEKVG